MADATPTNIDLCGAVIPVPFSTSLAADYNHGTDYTEASRQVGVVTHDASTTPRGTFVADSSKSPDSTTDERLLQVLRAGLPGTNRATIVCRDDSSDTWKGADRMGCPVYTQEIVDGTGSNAMRQASAAACDDGTMVLARTYTSAGDVYTVVHTRSTAGVWSAASTVVTFTPATSTTTPPCRLVWVGSGNARGLHLYTLYADPNRGDTYACYRSTDNGNTWTLQTTDCGVDLSSGTPCWLAGDAFPSGEVVLFSTSGSLGSSRVAQWRSTDGIYFTIVDAEHSTAARVHDVLFHGGYLHIAWTDNGNAAFTRIGSGSQLWHEEDNNLSGVTADYTGGMVLAPEPSGRLWAYISGDVSTAEEMTVYRSDDYGSSWTLVVTDLRGPTNGWAVRCAARLRGQIHVYVTSYVANTPSVGTSLWEVSHGGLSDYTTTQLVSDPNLRWIGLFTPTNDGWTNSDIGAPTRTLSGGVMNTATGAGVTATEGATVDGTSQNSVMVARFVAETNSGTARMEVKCAATIVDVFLTSTQIKAFEQGGSDPGYTTHSITGLLDIIVAVRSSDGVGVVAYREAGPDSYREYTELTTLSGMTTGVGTATVEWETQASSDTNLAFVAAGIGEAFGGGIFDGVTRPDDLDGIPISAAPNGYAYVGGGVHVKASGSYVNDGTTYTVPVDGLNPKRFVLPGVVPSPRRGCILSSGAAATFRFTPDHAAGSTTAFAPAGLWAVYLDGLEGIGDVTIYDTSGGASIGSTSRYTLSYELEGGYLRIDTGGVATVPTGYVRAGELVGWWFESANGDVRKIVENTDGYFDTDDNAHVPVMRLEDFDNGETASGTGYLYPSKMLILIHMRGGRRMDQLRLTFAAHTNFSRKVIGSVVAGPVHVMGRGVDRTMSVALEGGSTIQTMSDGSRSAVDLSPPRRRWEFGIGVDSVVDLANIWGDTFATEPDSVKTSDHASAKPAGTRHGTPLSVEGLYQQAGRDPLLFLPCIPKDPGTGDRAVVYVFRDALLACYGRLVNDTRRTLSLGRPRLNGMWRSSTIAIEEEL